MGLLKPNDAIPFNITRLSHVVLTSRDLDKTRYFYETGLGLEVTAQDATLAIDIGYALRATQEERTERFVRPL